MISEKLKARMEEEVAALTETHRVSKDELSDRHVEEWRAQRMRHGRVREGLTGRNLRLGSKHNAKWKELRESQKAAQNMLKKRHADLKAAEEGR